jgi:hypothetical protein
MHKRYTKVEQIEEAIREALGGLFDRRRHLLELPDLREVLDEEFPGTGGDPEYISDPEIDRFVARHARAIEAAWRRTTPGALKSLDDSRASRN